VDVRHRSVKSTLRIPTPYCDIRLVHICFSAHRPTETAEAASFTRWSMDRGARTIALSVMLIWLLLARHPGLLSCLWPRRPSAAAPEKTWEEVPILCSTSSPLQPLREDRGSRSRLGAPRGRLLLTQRSSVNPRGTLNVNGQ